MRRVWTVAAALAAAALVVSGMAGCGKAAEKVTEKAAEKAAEKAMEQSGGNAKVDIDSASGTVKVEGTDEKGNSYAMTTGADGDGSMNLTSSDGSTVQTGENVKIPDAFPKDVPVLDGLVVKVAQANPAEKQFSLQGTTKATPAEVVSFYKDKTTAGGWTETMSMNSGELQSLMYSKGDQALSVMVAKDGDGTSVSIAVTPQ